ncbi:hypothetical protein ACSBOB_08930 [Mesorhizobium sp. ASY16-5R]|uniref:hypothetical protein n=1 Tax=Mesorhizobium sp. ASY16-5R TaxID=3445772 RepID=UPI003F9F62F8
MDFVRRAGIKPIGRVVKLSPTSPTTYRQFDKPQCRQARSTGYEAARAMLQAQGLQPAGS